MWSKNLDGVELVWAMEVIHSAHLRHGLSDATTSGELSLLNLHR